MHAFLATGGKASCEFQGLRKPAVVANVVASEVQISLGHDFIQTLVGRAARDRATTGRAIWGAPG